MAGNGALSKLRGSFTHPEKDLTTDARIKRLELQAEEDRQLLAEYVAELQNLRLQIEHRTAVRRATDDLKPIV